MSEKSGRKTPIIPDVHSVVTGLIGLLELFMAHTYAAMAVGFVLLAVGFTPKQIAELTDVTDRTVRNWRSSLATVAACTDIHALLCRAEVDIGTKWTNVKEAVLRS